MIIEEVLTAFSVWRMGSDLMKVKHFHKKLVSVVVSATLMGGAVPLSALAEGTGTDSGQSLTSTSVSDTESSVDGVYGLARSLCSENAGSGSRTGGFTWDTEGKKRSWTYYNGIMMDAFLMADEEAFFDYVNSFYSANINGQGKVDSTDASDNFYRENELDSIPPSRALFDLLRRQDTVSENSAKYVKMIDYIYSLMQNFETVEGAGGNFKHKMNNANWNTYQVALDGLYMAQPFFMEVANALDDGTLSAAGFQTYSGIKPSSADIYGEVTERMLWIGDNLYDQKMHLYSHGWGPDAGLNGQYWLRAVGWYAAALADVISMLPESYGEEKNELIEIEKRLFDGMLEYRDETTGMWYNVINYGPDLTGNGSKNELETSGSALIAYAMMKSYVEGYLDDAYGEAGLMAFNGVVMNYLDDDGLHNVYISSGVETYPQGYLSKVYKVNEAKGVGPLIMAASYANEAAQIYAASEASHGKDSSSSSSSLGKDSSSSSSTKDKDSSSSSSTKDKDSSSSLSSEASHGKDSSSSSSHGKDSSSSSSTKDKDSGSSSSSTKDKDSSSSSSSVRIVIKNSIDAASYLPSLSGGEKVRFESSDKRIASVNSKGKIKGRKKGEATIRRLVSSAGEWKESGTLTILVQKPETISPEPEVKMVYGKQLSLSELISDDEDAKGVFRTNKKGKSIIALNEDGTFVPLAEGTAKITASYGKYRFKFKLNINGIEVEDGRIVFKYGVFLGAEPEDVPAMKPYEIIVLDAQYFSKETIKELKDSGHTVYSYINVGSIENFRPYYKDYEKFALGDYEHWDEEKWVDVSQKEWQDFIVKDLAVKLLDKGIDGFFVDNADVYYNYEREEIFEGMTAILKGLKNYGTYVSINGGDTYVMEYADRNKTLDPVMDAVNQETVFSAIKWKKNTFGRNTASERKYFMEYVETVKGYGKDVYLLEYTTDPELIADIREYCEKMGFSYYVSSSLELVV